MTTPRLHRHLAKLDTTRDPEVLSNCRTVAALLARGTSRAVVLAPSQSVSVPCPDLPTPMTPFPPCCEATPAASRRLDAAAALSRCHRTRHYLHDLPCRRGGWTCGRWTRHALRNARNTSGPHRRAAYCPRRRAPWPTSHVSCICLDKRCVHYRRMRRHGALLPPMPQ